MGKDQCRFCGSRKCYTRIATNNRGYDELACYQHIKELERHSDETLGVHNGVLRWHLSSSRPLMRGMPLPSERLTK